MIGHNAIGVDREGMRSGLLTKLVDDPAGTDGICKDRVTVVTADCDEVPVFTSVSRGRESNVLVPEIHWERRYAHLKVAATKIRSHR